MEQCRRIADNYESALLHIYPRQTPYHPITSASVGVFVVIAPPANDRRDDEGAVQQPDYRDASEARTMQMQPGCKTRLSDAVTILLCRVKPVSEIARSKAAHTTLLGWS